VGRGRSLLRVKEALRQLLDWGEMTHRELARQVKGRATDRYKKQAWRVCEYLRDQDNVKVADVLPSGEYVLALTKSGRQRAEYLKKKGEI